MNRVTQNLGLLESALAPETPQQPPLTAAEITNAIRQRWIGLFVWLSVCLAGAIGYLKTMPPTFVASALILLDPPKSSASSGSQEARFQPGLDAAQADSQIQVVKSERLLRAVFDTLGLATAPEFAAQPRRSPLVNLHWSHPAADTVDRSADMAFSTFVNCVGVRRIGQSYVLEVSYSAPAPELAASRANSIASAYLWNQLQDKSAAAARGKEIFQSRVSDLAEEAAAAMDAVVHGAVPSLRLPDADARIIGSATSPLLRASPQTGLTLALATSLSLLSGLSFVVLRRSLDRKVRTLEQLNSISGLEGLAAIRHVRDAALTPSNFGVPDRRGTGSEMWRSLQRVKTVLLSRAALADSFTIGVTSIKPGEGKSMLSVRLAELIASSGRTTTLIDCNLASPKLTRTITPSVENGLFECLSPEHSAREPNLVPLKKHLSFIPAFGANNSQNGEVSFSLPSLRGMFDVSSVRRGVVIADLSSVSCSADALTMAQHFDCVILVVKSGENTFAEVRDVALKLAASSHFIGGIINCQ